MTTTNVVNVTPQTTPVNTFLNLLRDRVAAEACAEAHNQLCVVLSEIKMLSPGSTHSHIGKVQKCAMRYEEEEAEEFSRLVRAYNATEPKADEPVRLSDNTSVV